MDRCCINDLRDKEVINICDGRRMGCIVDVEVDICDGRLVSIVVPGEKNSLFGKSDDITIPWCNIRRIGDDIILVDVAELQCPQCDCDRTHKKRIF